jgi:hypothetical protein
MPSQSLALTLALQTANDPKLSPHERLRALECVTKLVQESERRTRRLAKQNAPAKPKKKGFTIMDDEG